MNFRLKREPKQAYLECIRANEGIHIFGYLFDITSKDLSDFNLKKGAECQVEKSVYWKHLLFYLPLYPLAGKVHGVKTTQSTHEFMRA